MPQISRSPSPPVEVDLARVVRAGMALWLVGLVVTLVVAIVGSTGWVPFAVCVTGLALGGLALLWARRH